MSRDRPRERSSERERRERARGYVVHLRDLTSGDVARVGGKNASLGEMIRALRPAGIHVPPGFATTADAYWDLLAANGLTKPIETTDSTGAGDAFDAGFLVAWLGDQPGDDAPISTALLRRATLAGHRVAARHLGRPAEELVLG